MRTFIGQEVLHGPIFITPTSERARPVKRTLRPEKQIYCMEFKNNGASQYNDIVPDTNKSEGIFKESEVKIFVERWSSV